jgi:hypothetical protein
MTPKEKAEDIWMQLFQKQIDVTGNGYGELCVEMALIVVDEIIKDQNGDDATIGNKTWWWEEVKQEIINL